LNTSSGTGSLRYRLQVPVVRIASVSSMGVSLRLSAVR
jgi:hypothetical protein